MLCYDFQKRYSEADVEAMEKMNTRQLLKLHRISYLRSEFCSDCCGDLDECTDCLNNEKFNKAVIKRLLSTREHVPNKQESKALRKQRIKEGR